MKLNPLALICIAVLCAILTLGLWPFHSPRNEVAWLRNPNGLQFGRNGTVISRGSFEIKSPHNNPEATLEICLKVGLLWSYGTFLAFYRPGNLIQFSLRQSLRDLLVKTEAKDDQPHGRAANVYIQDAFSRKPGPVFVTITAGVQGTCVYIDGVPAAALPQFPLSAGDFTGRLILGDSPRQTDSWYGQLLGIAIYNRRLTATQVLHNYASWKQTGRLETEPEIKKDEGAIALYPFDEHSGDVVRDKLGSGVDLYIPERYTVMDQIMLEPFWTEFELSWNYWMGALKNVVGFIPFGFCFYAYLATLLPIKRAALVTVALGTTVSFTIEILQGFIPTRDSGMTDLITNTLGAWVGVASYNPLTPILNRFFPWLPFRVPPPL
jgi:hypothetical protein